MRTVLKCFFLSMLFPSFVPLTLPLSQWGREGVRGDLAFWLGPAFLFDSILNCEPNRKMTERLQVGNVGRRKKRQVKV
jgi:hypothetical protein